MTPDQRERLARIRRGQALARAEIQQRAATARERHERQTELTYLAWRRTHLHRPHRATPRQENR